MDFTRAMDFTMAMGFTTVLLPGSENLSILNGSATRRGVVYGNGAASMPPIWKRQFDI